MSRDYYDRFFPALKRLKDFRAWLAAEERLNGKSAEEWAKEYPGCEQAHYRNGMWYATHQIRKMFESARIDL